MDQDLLYRSAVIEREDKIDIEARTVELSFSSETPVERAFGNEVLDHQPESVDLARLDGGAPLLLEHDRSQQVGVIERAWLDEALDCRVYAMAALEILNPNFEKLIENLTKTEVEEAPKQPKTMKEAPPVVKKGGGFVNAWR